LSRLSVSILALNIKVEIHSRENSTFIVKVIYSNLREFNQWFVFYNKSSWNGNRIYLEIVSKDELKPNYTLQNAFCIDEKKMELFTKHKHGHENEHESESKPEIKIDFSVTKKENANKSPFSFGSMDSEFYYRNWKSQKRNIEKFCLKKARLIN
jgi:hypothetical protein